MNEPRIVTLDIETAPIEARVWGIWEVNIGLDQITCDWSILSFAAKFLDSNKIHYKDTSGRGAKHVRDDKAVCGELWKILDDADIVIAQNGVSFDIKKVNSRLAVHGFGPYSPVRVVDTLRAVKKHFGYTSNKLAFLSKTLTPETKKSEHRKFPGISLWNECLTDNKAAWAEMKKYNIRDVVATEQLYLKLRPWLSSHPSLGTFYPSSGTVCPKCSSDKVQARGFSITQTGKYQRFQCQSCFGWSRGKENLLTASKRKSILV